MERLVFISGPMEGQAFDLVNPEVTIGRELSNRLPLEGDRCVSRRHARIVRTGTGLLIEDLGSTNGTAVNGQKIDRPVQLAPGDLIQMAYHQIRVEWSPMAFGPNVEDSSGGQLQLQPQADYTWLLGLLPSILIAPVGLVYFQISGFDLLPFSLVLFGLGLGCTGLIRFFRPSNSSSAVETSFIQTLSGSALAIVGALWLNYLG